MKIFFVAVMLLFSTLSFGANNYVATDGLTKVQKDKIAEAINDMKTENNGGSNNPVVSISETTRKEVTAWGQLGANVGTAMMAAAKELGVAASEFSQTGLGKVVTAIIVWKIMGASVLSALVGIGLMTFGVILLCTNILATKEYEYKPTLWGAFNRRCVKSFEYTEGQMALKFIAGIFFIIAGAIAASHIA